MGERPCQREGLAAREGEIPDAAAAEAVWQVCQREGCAIFERVVTDAGEAVRQASQRDGFAAMSSSAKTPAQLTKSTNDIVDCRAT